MMYSTRTPPLTSVVYPVASWTTIWKAVSGSLKSPFPLEHPQGTKKSQFHSNYIDGEPPPHQDIFMDERLPLPRKFGAIHFHPLALFRSLLAVIRIEEDWSQKMMRCLTSSCVSRQSFKTVCSWERGQGEGRQRQILTPLLNYQHL